MSTLTIKLSEEAEATILKRMESSGDTNRSKHVIDGYLNNLGNGNSAIEEVASDVDALGNAVIRTNKLLEQLIGMRDDKVELTVLASIFLMLHQSVAADIRAEVDKYIDSKTVKNFLKTGCAT